jgi:hypothetical protein
MALSGIRIRFDGSRTMEPDIVSEVGDLMVPWTTLTDRTKPLEALTAPKDVRRMADSAG